MPIPACRALVAGWRSAEQDLIADGLPAYRGIDEEVSQFRLAFGQHHLRPDRDLADNSAAAGEQHLVGSQSASETASAPLLIT